MLDANRITNSRATLRMSCMVLDDVPYELLSIDSAGKGATGEVAGDHGNVG